MFTNKDIKYRTIFVINCIRERSIRVSNGELLLEEPYEDSDKMKTLTKLPFQKILALFVIGHMRVTTPLIEKCKKHGVSLVVMKPSLRPVFFWADSAEANFLLRGRQYELQKTDISIAKVIVENKIRNQMKALNDTRRKDERTEHSRCQMQGCLDTICDINDYNALMGLEGIAAKAFFAAFYQDFDWHQRRPRTKCDVLNATLDIGYTILFNYIECFLRMFGFDIYVGVYHRMWFKRKSLVCDVVEPFRPIIDKAVRTAWNRKQFSEKDFLIHKGEYRLRYEHNAKYCRVFFDALIPYKTEVFKYIQSYYRCFMGRQSVKTYPMFLL
ncbi:MAG: type V CRISPR-associated endonuclease Cas1 [Bacteroides sp.]|nr:type V CRISPR-associated endonuclease Cas1 [Lachnospiraceae bacterium]MCM1371633.1 type V CRISPR-associated endonuclease Cas1 [Bacteroides sp.]MCM1446756.1 type V CRISPR-associated endonuclease Cas1 [Bacteroides sp.]